MLIAIWILCARSQGASRIDNKGPETSKGKGSGAKSKDQPNNAAGAGGTVQICSN